MISISRQTDYACRVILHLSLLPPGTRVTAQDIAKQRLIPRAMVRRIVTRLGAARLLKTSRGSGGGLALARLPKQISLLNVVEAMEGQLLLNPCTLNPQACPLMAVCTVHDAWVKARDTLVSGLTRTTFDQLAQRGIQRVKKGTARRRVIQIN
jgi:Rrf2 family protein